MAPTEPSRAPSTPRIAGRSRADGWFAAILFLAGATGFYFGFRGGGVVAGIAVGTLFFFGAVIIAVPAFALAYALFQRGLDFEERVFFLVWFGSAIVAFFTTGFAEAWETAPFTAFVFFRIGFFIALVTSIIVYTFRRRRR